jgi:hypothetical protein
MVEMGGPKQYASLVLFFRTDASRQQVTEFHDEILSKPSPYGPNTGLDLPDGVAGEFNIRNNGYEGFGISFSTDATPEQRDLLERRIKESPIVYRVYKGVIPSQIHDL